jgi:membrane-associated protein
MLHDIVDFSPVAYQSGQLIQLLSTLLSSWLGYAALAASSFPRPACWWGIFVPGDSLLFTVGWWPELASSNIVLVNVLLMLAAMIGDSTGYLSWAGRRGRASSAARIRASSSRSTLRAPMRIMSGTAARPFIIARFVPIVRTFAAFMAGVGQMPYLRFLPFSVCGGIGWVFLMTMLGYELGGMPFIHHYFDKVILAIIFLSIAHLIEVIGRGATAAPDPLPISSLGS